MPSQELLSRRALCIGINYPGTDAQLAGCVNDAHDWAAELDRRGYAVGLAVDAKATREVILGAISELVDSASAGDRVVITYSGHGSWQPDRDGDEPDGRDELILPVDFRTAGPIVDDELYRLFAPAARGVRLVFVADSCFSGTLRRFGAPIGAALPGAGHSYRRARFLPPAEFLDGADLQRAQAVERAPARGRFRRSALTLSACRDDQTAYDAVVDGRPCGIFSSVALAMLREADHPVQLDYRGWLRRIASRLPSVDYPDVNPQLDGTSTQRRWEALA